MTNVLERKLRKAWKAYHDACSYGHVLRAAYDRGDIDEDLLWAHIRKLDRLYLEADRLHNELHRGFGTLCAARGVEDRT